LQNPATFPAAGGFADLQAFGNVASIFQGVAHFYLRDFRL